MRSQLKASLIFHATVSLLYGKLSEHCLVDFILKIFIFTPCTFWLPLCVFCISSCSTWYYLLKFYIHFFLTFQVIKRSSKVQESWSLLTLPNLPLYWDNLPSWLCDFFTDLTAPFFCLELISEFLFLPFRSHCFSLASLAEVCFVWLIFFVCFCLGDSF